MDSRKDSPPLPHEMTSNVPTMPQPTKIESAIQSTDNGTTPPSIDTEKTETTEEVTKQTNADLEKPGGPPQAADLPPEEGLQGWMVAIGCLCANLTTAGWFWSIGVFQSYYQQVRYTEDNPSTIAWTQSLEVAILFFMGPFTGAWFSRYGARPLIISGSIIHVFGLMMASLTKEYWQVVLAQGIFSPIGAGILYHISLQAPIPWFPKKPALIQGIVFLGGSIGSVYTPILMENVTRRLSFDWAIRITAFTYLFFLTIASFTIKSRVPPNPRPTSLQDMKIALKDPWYTTYLLAVCLTFMSLYVALNFIVVQAQVQAGMSARLAGYLLPICNAFGIPGRLIPTLFADRYFGRFNVLIAMVLMQGVVTLACWIPARSNAVVLVYAGLLGFSSSAIPPLEVAGLVPITTDKSKMPIRVGLAFLFGSVPTLVSNPVAGAILGKNNQHFLGLKIWAGVFMIAAAILFAGVRVAKTGWKLIVRI